MGGHYAAYHSHHVAVKKRREKKTKKTRKAHNKVIERNEEKIHRSLLCISSSTAYFIHNLTESRACGRRSMVLTECLLYVRVTLTNAHLPQVLLLAHLD